MSIRHFLQRTQLLLDQALYASRRALEPMDASGAVDVTPLEERLLMSASPVVVAAEAAVEAPQVAESGNEAIVDPAHDRRQLDLIADAALPPAESVVDLPAALASEAASQTLELVIIDSSVSQLDQMIADLRQEDALDDDRTLEIVVLDGDRDGVAQITAALLQYDGIDGVHIVSHGSAGQVQLGSTVLSLDTLDTYRSAINAWQHSLTAEADLLFYGCDLAATADGRELMAQISAACNCDVSASEDLTGHASLGGDWELEYTVGAVSTQTVFSDHWQDSWRSVLAGITVTTTNDTVDGDADLSSVAALQLTPGSDGEVSLREAILAANNGAGTDTISFAITDPLVNGAHTISLVSALPDITDTLIIDGTTEPDAIANGNRPVVVLDGGGVVLDGLVLTATADNSVVRGLSLRSLQNAAIVINSGADSVTVAGNTIGRLATDGSDSGSGDIGVVGVSVSGSNAIIGGTTAADRNVIAGATRGIVLDGASGAIVSGNYIGTTGDGSAVIGLTSDGILLQNGAALNTIGGATAAAGNVIVGTGGDAIRVDGASSDDNTIRHNQIGVSADGAVRLGVGGSGVFITGGADSTLIEDNLIAAAGGTGVTVDGVIVSTRIDGNTIGTNAAGTLNWGVGSDGILITGGATQVQIGGIAASDGNTIAHSGQTSGDGAGIAVHAGSTGVTIRGNSLHSNRGVGIDLTDSVNDGANVNDVADSDTGGNLRLNTPILHAASVDDADTLSVSLDLTALPTGTYTIDFYASSATSSGSEAERYLFSATGVASGFTGTLAPTLAGLTPGERLTAVAVDEVTGDTSEISRHAVLVDADTGGTTPASLHVVSGTGGLQLNTAGADDGVITVADGNAVFDGLSALTFDVRFAATTLSAGTTFASYTTVDGDDLFRLRIADDGLGLNFTVNGTANSVDVSGFDFSTLADGADHTLTLTWDGGTGNWTVFVDGQFAAGGSGAATGSIASTAASLVFGQEQDGFQRDFDPAQAFHGELHNVRVFDAVRSASDIAADHRSDLAFDTTALVADWRFDELTVGGQIVEAVQGRNASVESIQETGFTAGDTALRLEVAENAANGTVIGSVAGVDAERDALIASLLAADPYLFYSEATGKFYQLTGVQANWSVASTNALATSLNGVSGQLVTVRSAWENEFVRQVAETENLSVFIGGTDTTVDGEWRWQSAGADADAFWTGGSGGSSQNDAWYNWAPGQPANAIGANGIRLEESTGYWHEIPVGSVSRRSVIEWDAATVLASVGGGSIGAAPLSYEIVSQTQAGAFAIDATTGELRVADSSQLDYENPPTTHAVVIRVSDAATPTQTYEQTLQIHLTDVADTDAAPTALRTGITLNTDGGTDAWFTAVDAGSLLGGRDAITLEVTLALEQTQQDQTLLGYANATATDDLQLSVLESGALQLTVGGNQASVANLDYHALLTDGHLHTVAVTWDSTHGDWTIHIDGAALASGSGLSTGHTLGGQTGDTAFILGQQQGSIGGTFAASHHLSGTIYDVRLWNLVRTDAELRDSHGRQFDPGDVAAGLIANWQMTSLDASGRVLDEVAAHVLRTGHANEAEFSRSTPTADLLVSENAVDGAVVGRVVPRDPGVPADLVSDGRFLQASTPASIDNYLSGQSLGGWDVTAGSVGLYGPTEQRSPLGGLSVSLNGTTAGTIQQDLTTVAGTEYQVVFVASGRWDGGETVKDLRVSAGASTQDYALTQPTGWSNSNKLWSPRSFTFTATGPSTTLQFASLDGTGGAFGPLIADVQVYAVPAAVSHILNGDPSLSYDAGTGKFYRLESAALSFSAARAAANASLINGVAGRLVTIDSPYENDLVHSFAQGQGDSLWIGASDTVNEGDWAWLDTTTAATFWTGGQGGAAVSPHYHNWGGAEPNNSTGLLPQGEDAAAITIAGTWFDWEDDALNQLGYVVEWDASELLNHTTYSLNDPSGQFELTSDGILSVRSGHTLDHDASASHDVDVTVTDAAGNSFTQTLTIQVQEAGGQADEYLISEDGLLSVAAPGLLANDSTVGVPVVPGSAVLSFDARTDTDGDATWTGTGGALNLAGVTHTTSPSSPPAGITAAFDFDGSGGATSAALESLAVVDATQSGSVEMWVRLDATSGSQTLLDLGSDTDGISLAVSSGQLILTFEDGGSSDIASVSGVTAGTWHHLAVTFEMISGSSQQAVVWLDGTQVISRSYTTLANWAGGDFGLGTVNGTAAGAANGNLAGEIASLRVHDRVLSAAQIASLVAHPEALADGHAVVSAVDNAGTLGTVSVNADGSFTYDPNGQFDALAGGQTATDSFTYTVDDGTGATESAMVTITVIGSGELAITRPVSVTLNEDTPHTFSAGDVVQIDDGIAADTRVQVTLQVDSGTLSLSSTTNVSVIEGADNSGRMVLVGLESDVNTALSGLVYTPFADVSGADTLTVTLELAADLQARFSFDDSTADDSSAGIAHHGRLEGGATIVSALRGPVLNLDAAGERLVVDSVFDQPTNLTVAGWVNLTNAGTLGAEFVSLSDDLILRLDDTVYGTSLWARKATGWNVVSTGESLQGTGWRHVAATFDDDGNQQAVYIDGQAIATQTFADSIHWSGGASSVWGAHAGGSADYDFGGQIDEARVYARALSAAEIAALAAEQTQISDTTSLTVAAVNDAPSFHLGTGQVVTDFGSGDDHATAVAVMPDGRLVVAGYASNGSDHDFAVARYQRDGSLDTTFGGTGLVTVPIGGGLDQAYAVAVQDDGRILLAGESANGGSEVAIVRLQTDGTLDPAWGGGSGIVTSDFGSGSDIGYDLIQQPDGRVLVSGSSWNGSGYDVLLARYTTSGALDAFGTGGFVTTSVGTADAAGYAVDVRADGRIVVGGQAMIAGNEDLAIVRYLADGTLDTTFGTAGVVTTAVTAQTDGINSLVSLDDGRLLVGGLSTTATETNYVLARYLNDGSLDTSFGTGGVVTSALSGDDVAHSIAMTPDGKILLAATTGSSPTTITVARYDADGTLDMTFGSSGLVVETLSTGDDVAAKIVVRADGSFALVGATQDDDRDFVLLSYAADGTRDSAFGQVSTLNHTPTHLEGGAAVVLAPAASLLDPELSAGGFAGSHLILERTAGASTDDLFEATGTLSTLTPAGSLTVGGVTIGTVTTNGGGTLRLDFSGPDATASRINETLRQIGYRHASDTPPVSVSLTWTFNDGNDGAAQGTGAALPVTGTTNVSIQAAPDPLVTAPVAISLDEDTSTPFDGSNTLSVSSGFSTDTRVQVSLTVGSGSLTVTTAGSVALVDGSNASDGFVLEGRESEINTTLATLTYDPAAEFSGSTTLSATLSLSADLVADYDLAGDATDSSVGAAQDGTPVGTAAFTSDGTRGQVLLLDGGGHVSVGTDFGQPATATVSGWVLLDAAAPDAVLWNVGGDLELRIDVAGGVTGRFHDGGQWQQTVSGVDIRGNGWHHLAYTVDATGNTQVLYVNGLEVARTTFTGGVADVGSFVGALIGTDGSGNSLVGRIDDARLHTRALSAEEVAGLATDQTPASASVAVTVNSVNDAPEFADLDGDVLGYTEGDGAQLIDQGGDAAISDVDSVTFNGGTLVVSLTGGSDASQDVLSVRDEGLGLGNVSLSGSTILYSGVPIASMSGGASGTPLTITFNAVSSSIAATQVLRNITYENTNTVSATGGLRTVTFVMSDGDGPTGVSLTQTASINVGSPNDPPVITSGVGGGTYFEGASGTYFNNSLTVADADSSDFDGGRLSVDVVTNGESDDRLLVRDGAGVTVSGSTLLFDPGSGAVAVATFTGGAGSTTLEITFNASADLAAVQAVARQVAFASVSDTPSTAQRSLEMQLSDGDGGTSNTVTRSMNVVPVNDAPLLDLDADDSSGSLLNDYQASFTEGLGAVLVVDADATLSDADHANLASLTIVLTNPQEPGSEEHLSADTSGTALVASWTQATHTLTVSGVGTVADFQTVLRTVRYDNSSTNPETATDRIITFVADDGTDDSLTARTTVQLNSVNNLPTISAVSSQTINEDTATGALAFTVGDAETAAASLVVSAVSDNQTIIPNANITLGGSGAARTVNVLPAAHQNGGPVTITLSVFDGVHTVQTSFTVSVTARNDVPTGAPVVTGTPTEDQLLTADVSGIADDDGLGSFSYQWLRDGGVISGAESSTFVLSDADVGTLISVSVSWIDGQGNSESLTSSPTTAIANINDAPTTTNSAPLDLFTDEENPTAPVTVAAILTHAGWSDADAAANRGLAVTATNDQDGEWQYSTNGSDWETISGTSPSSSLLLDATTQLRYEPDDDDSVTATLTFRAWDQTTGAASTQSVPRFASTLTNGGTSAFDGDARQVRAIVSDVADAPVISHLSGDALLYAEGDNAAVLDQLTAAIVTDVDSSNFNGGYLSVSFDSGSDPAEDVLQVRDQGTAAGQIGVSGFNVTYGGTLIGTLSGGTSGTPLRIDFNASASPTAATALVRNITFLNTNTNHPTEGVRAVRFTLSDGDGGVSSTTTTAVSVSQVNDAPVLSAPGSATVFEETRTTLSGISVVDVDAGTADITARLQVTQGVLDVTLAGSVTVSAGSNGTSDLTLRGTLSEVNATLNNLDYTGNMDVTGVAADSLTLTVSDLGNTGSGGVLTDTATVSIDITAVNDPPVIGNNGFSILEGGTVTLSAAVLSATDVDSVADDLTFTVSNVTGGQFELASAPQIAVSSFQQSQITAGAVRFVHDGGEVAPAYDVTVSDGLQSVGPQSGSITFTNVNDAPVISGLGGDASSAVNDGVPVRIDTGVAASIEDPESPASYDGALLQVAQSGAEVGDLISLDTMGNLQLSAGLTDGSVVRVSGDAVGTLSSVTDVSFDLTFQAGAETSDVNAVLNALQFSTTSAVLGPRSIDVTFNDGDGTAFGGTEVSSVATAFLSVAGAGDGNVSTDEDTTYTFVSTDFDFTGVTGSGLQEIELLSLPVAGTLRYNGAAATVGQVVTQTDIQNGLLTFEPAADENGFNYGTFDFQVNNGKANVTILAGEASFYTLTGGALFHTEDILTDPTNFGPSGTYASSFSLIGQTSTIGPAYLNQGSILFNGYVPDGSWTSQELSDLDDWVQNGGVLISNSDSNGYDDVSAHFGLTIGGTGTTTWLVDDVSSPIINGAFGSVGPIGTSIRATGAISYFDSSSLASGDLVIAIDSGSLEPTIVLRQHGNGWILFTSDEGIFRVNMSGGGNVTTSNDTLAANIFAWAADQVPATSSHTMNVSVLARNDDPVNNGTLPATFVVNEDQQTPIDLSSLDVFDLDAATNALTVTLTTQSGGQLSAIAAGGVTISGSGSSSLELSGSQADLNAFFDNSLNISFTSATDQNGLASDRITVQLTDNGNLGDGGGGQVLLGAIDVDVTAVNDAPVATAPGLVSVVEETPTMLSGFSVADVDAGSDSLSVRLQATEGIVSLTLSGAVVSGGGNATTDVTITGTLAQLNAALATLIYTPDPDIVGTAADQIVMTVDDGGNNGSGGSLQASQTVQVNVFNVNDEQLLATNTGLVLNEGELSVTIEQTNLEVSDVDNLPTEIVYVLDAAPTSGALRLSGVALTVGQTFTQEDINAGRLTYDHNDAEVFFDQITFTADDGSGTTTTADFDFSINPVNDNNPFITSNGGLATIAVDVTENTLDVVDVDASDIDLPAQSIAYVIAGGADAALFSINPGSGEVTFVSLPDYESVIDADGNNIYEVVVEARDGLGRSAVQNIAVTITNVDEFGVGLPFDADVAPREVAENSPLGTPVGLTVAAVDGDRSDVVTYALDDDAGGRFAIDPASGVVTLVSAVDRETDAAFTITARATSSDGTSTTADFLISINDVDEFDTTAITDLNAAAEVINENVSIGTSVGVVAFASDADATNNLITWSLDDNAGGLLTIDGGGHVTTAAAVDFEAVGSSLSFTARATSQDGSFTTRTWNVSVLDLDEFDVSPIVDADTAANSVSENLPAGSVVGVTAFSEDGDATNSGVQYSLDDTAGGRFTIDSASGVITTARVLDFESGGVSHDVIVRAVSDDGSSTTTIVTIAISDQDEFDVTPIVDVDIAPERLDENTAVGTAVGFTAFSEDADGSLNAVSYTLDDDAGGLFRVDAVSGQIQTNAAIDFETTGAAATVVVRATSADGSSVTRSVVLTIDDVNEFAASPILDTDAATDRVIENAAIGTSVGITAFSEDQDATLNSIVYSLDDTAGGLFGIDAVTGVVMTAALPDFEALGGPQSIVVRATSADGSFATRTFSVAVVDTNDTRPVIASGQQFAVSEFATTGTSLGTVLATDADTVGSLTGWAIVAGNTDGIFAINSSTGELTVDDPAALNHENVPTWTLTVTVTDGLQTSATQTVEVSVTDENDAPVLTASAFDIDEHTTAGTVVDTAVTFDEDVGEVLTYSLQGPPAQAFAIDPTSGVITVADPTLLDFEIRTSLTVTVQVEDSGGLTDVRVLTININDVNERPLDIAFTGASVAENSLTGTAVSLANATDIDAGDVVTYSLVSSAGGRFQVDAVTGVIRVDDGTQLNFEQQSSHEIVVRATDAGGLFYDESLTIAVSDVNEAPVAGDDFFEAKQLEDLIVGVASGVTTNDIDVDGDTIRVIIVTGPDNGSLSLQSDGSFTYTPAGVYSGPDSFQYVLTDGRLFSEVATVEIDVLTTVAADSGNKTTVIEPTTSTEQDEPDFEVEEEASEAEESETIETEQPLTTAASSSAATGEGTGEEAVGVAASASREILQRTSSSLFVAVFLDDVPLVEGLDENGRGGRRDRTEGDGRLGRALPRFLFEQISTETPFLRTTTFDITQAQFLEPQREDSFLNVVMESVVVGSSAAVTTSVSVGYVVWLVRGGSLITSVLSSIPIWQGFDPLPVLESFEEESGEDAESLVSMVSGTENN